MPNVELEILADIAEAAGHAIMDVRARGYRVEEKPDHSPVTEADLAANAVILRELAARFPAISVLTEEGADIPYENRAPWPRLFIVDPLDGTKEFVKELGEFCVCIALAEAGFSKLGAVHAPVSGATYVGGQGLGAFRRAPGVSWEPIAARKVPAEGLTVLHVGDQETWLLSAARTRTNGCNNGSPASPCATASPVAARSNSA